MRLLIVIFFIINLYAKELYVEQLFNVELIKVKKLNFSESKTFYGEAKIDESRVSDITLRFDGFIEKLYIDKSFDYIKRGEKLFEIYSPEIFLAQNEYINIGDKNRRLGDSIIKKLELLGIDNKFIKEIKKQKEPKEYIPIYSSVDGFVIEKRVNSGSFVKKGSLLYRVANLNKLWVIAKVYEKDVSFLNKNLEAKITFDGVAEIYGSKLDFIYPKVNSDKTIDVRFKIDNSQLKVFPNAFSKVEIIKDKREVLTLPKSAVITKGDKYIVFIAGEYEGEYEPKEVEAKRLNSQTFEIISGLNENDNVVNNSLFLFDSDVQINGG